MNKYFYPSILLLCLLPGVVIAQQFSALDTSYQSVGNKICATCHGAYGQGNPVVGAPSLAGLEPWYLRKQLLDFREKRRGIQPDYIPGYEMQAAVQKISDVEIESVIEDVGSWETRDYTTTLIGNINSGAQLYSSCAACHGADGNGNQALGAPSLAGRDDWYLLKQIKLFQSGYRGAHPEDIAGAQMRAAVDTLESEQDINDVLAYINTLN